LGRSLSQKSTGEPNPGPHDDKPRAGTRGLIQPKSSIRELTRQGILLTAASSLVTGSISTCIFYDSLSRYAFRFCFPRAATLRLPGQYRRILACHLKCRKLLVAVTLYTERANEERVGKGGFRRLDCCLRGLAAGDRGERWSGS